MAWLIVGDDTHATFACNTGDVGFGPLHSRFDGRSAKEELIEFSKTLNEDPRKLDGDRLRSKYYNWLEQQRKGVNHTHEVGDVLLDTTEPTPSPEANTVIITELIDERANEHVVDETGKTVAEHNPFFPTDDPVVVGRYPNMGGDKEFHFPESRLG